MSPSWRVIPWLAGILMPPRTTAAVPDTASTAPIPEAPIVPPTASAVKPGLAGPAKRLASFAGMRAPSTVSNSGGELLTK